MFVSMKPLPILHHSPSETLALVILPPHIVRLPLGFHPVSSGCLQVRQAAKHSWKMCSCWVKCDSAWTRLQQVLLSMYFEAGFV